MLKWEKNGTPHLFGWITWFVELVSVLESAFDNLRDDKITRVWCQ